MSASDVVAARIGTQAELGASALRGQSPADLGQQVAAGVASSTPGVTSVDAAQLLALVQQMQARLEAVEAERAAEKREGLPSIVAQAELIYAHLAHRNSALAGAGDLADITDRAAGLVDAARSAAASGDASEAVILAGALARRLSRASAPVDVSYPLQLLQEDFPETAAALRKPAAAGAGPGPVVHTF
jgi:hypothetical protein